MVMSFELEGEVHSIERQAALQIHGGGIVVVNCEAQDAWVLLVKLSGAAIKCAAMWLAERQIRPFMANRFAALPGCWLTRTPEVTAGDTAMWMKNRSGALKRATTDGDRVARREANAGQLINVASTGR
jgi:hypothetical protein